MQAGPPTPDPSKGGEFRKAGRKPVNAATARNAALINLCVTPGMGSLMAGRFVAGLGQLLVAVAGFTLVIIWFVRAMTQYYGMINGEEVSLGHGTRFGIAGAITFIIAWLWALATSVGLIHEARRDESNTLNRTG